MLVITIGISTTIRAGQVLSLTTYLQALVVSGLCFYTTMGCALAADFGYRRAHPRVEEATVSYH